MYILSFSRIKEIWCTPFRTFIRLLIKSNVSRIFIYTKYIIKSKRLRSKRLIILITIKRLRSKDY